MTPACSTTIPPNDAKNKKVYTASDIPGLLQTLNATLQDQNQSESLLESIRGFRRMLSVEHNPPVAEVLESGVVPTLVQLLLHPSENIPFEAAWALTNVASTEHTSVLVECGAVPPLVGLLLSDDAEVRDQVCWCLGNIAGDSPALRDVVLQAGAMAGVLQNITQPASPSLLGNAVWTLSNLCRGKPPHVNMEYVAPAIPVLVSLLQPQEQTTIAVEVQIDACWALSYLCDGKDDRIQMVMDSGVTPVLINNLSREGLVTPSLRALGNFVSGSDVQTQMVLDHNILDHILSILKHPKRSVRREAYWLLSNIAAGSEIQVKQLFQPRLNPNNNQLHCILGDIILAAESEVWEARKEAVWVLSNITSSGNEYFLKSLVTNKAIPALCSVLTLNDSKITMLALDAIESMLVMANRTDMLIQYVSYLEEAGGIEKLEELQEHASDDVYQKALHLIVTYFGEEQENENLAPDTNGNRFVFGTPATEGIKEKSLDESDDVIGEGWTNDDWTNAPALF